MADTKTTALTALTAPADGDLAMVVDVSDTTMDAAGTNKKITLANLRTMGQTTFSNADATIAAATRYLAQTGTMSAARTVTLPAANAVPAGTEIVVADQSGTVTSAFSVTVTRAGSDTVEGGTTHVIRLPYGHVRLVSDGTSAWTRVGRAPLPLGYLYKATNRWHMPVGVTAGAAGSQTAAADTSIAWWLLYFPEPTTIAAVGVYCYTLEAGSLVRLGLYHAAANFTVGNLIVDYGTVSGASTGAKTITGLSTVAPAGYSWLAAAQSTHTTVRWGRYQVGNQPGSPMGTDIQYGRPFMGWTATGTDYSGGLPSTNPGGLGTLEGAVAQWLCPQYYLS